MSTHEIAAAMGDVPGEADGHVVTFNHYAGELPGSSPQSPPVRVNVFIQEDGATVVQIDTETGTDRLRVNVNDSTPFDRGVETGIRYEKDEN